MDLHNDPELVPSNRNFWEFKGKIDYVDQWMLMESPIPIITIVVSYLIFVLKLGPDYVKKRDAFKLKGLIIAYNFLQMVLSAYLTYLGLQIIKPLKYIFLSCENDEEEMGMLTNTMHIYFLAKVSELFDTVLFVLRKKQKQVSFLHVYHHTMMVAVCWLLLKYDPSNSTIFTVTINSFVHIIMYGYYALSAFPSLSKYLWWKKYLTGIQLVQLAMIFLHPVGNFIISECQPSTMFLYMSMFTSSTFLGLFGDFYIKSYIKNKKEN